MGMAGRGAVVTGGGRGIGAAVARALSQAGVGVVVCARTADEIETVAATLRDEGGVAHAVVCDVADPDSVAIMASRAQALLGTVDVVVNNAGIAGSAPFLRVTREQWEHLHRVNAVGPLLVTQALLPAMLARRWGRVVNVASVASLEGNRYITSYTASKHALIGMARCLAAELAGTGVTVNSVCPAYVDTPMTDRNIAFIATTTGRDAAAVRDNLADRQPGGRLITADEVAHAVMTFMPDEASALHGVELVVRGGGGSGTGAGS